MVVVRGLSVAEVIRRSSEIDVVIEREMRAVAAQAADSLGQVIVAAPVRRAASPNDINFIRTLWRDIVDRSLMGLIADALFAASRAVSIDFNRILGKVLDDNPQWRPPDTRGTDGRRQAPPQRAGQRVYQPPPSTRGTDGNVVVDLPDDDDDFFLDPLDENQATEAILANSRNRLVGIGDELWEQARDELVAGMNEGESIDKLAARVRGAADVASPRARTIARTEVIGACNAGSILTMRSSDLAATKIWLATPDTRTRLDHRIAQGQTVPLDAPFIVGGVPLDHPGDDAGPADQVINCRCTLAYDVEELPTPAGEDDSDDIEGFDPSMFPDVDFSVEELHLPGKHNQGSHRNKRKKSGDNDSDGDGSSDGGDSGDSGDSGSGGDSKKVEPRNPPAEPLSRSDFSRLVGRYENDYDMVGIDLNQARDAMDSYVGNDYSDINGGMRRGNVNDRSQETIDAINKVFDSGVLTNEPFVSYRGLGNVGWTFGKVPEPGDVFRDPAFGSTTANRETADTFLDGAGGTTGLSLKRIAEFDPSALDNAAVLEINVPTGSRIIPVDAIRGGSPSFGEREILLPPNSELRVVDVTPADPDSTTPRIIHMEVISSD